MDTCDQHLSMVTEDDDSTESTGDDLCLSLPLCSDSTDDWSVLRECLHSLRSEVDFDLDDDDSIDSNEDDL